jgi:hypothetical protein
VLVYQASTVLSQLALQSAPESDLLAPLFPLLDSHALGLRPERLQRLDSALLSVLALPLPTALVSASCSNSSLSQLSQVAIIKRLFHLRF